MKSNRREPRRKNIRLKEYDYALPGGYFVTICTHFRECVFGQVANGEMRLSAFGAEISRCWLWLADRYSYVHLDQWVIMPNHLHGIITILDEGRRGGSRTAPDDPIGKRKPLGGLVGAFKTLSTKNVNRFGNTSGRKLWQRNYYEHVIRNEDDLNQIRQYILENPIHWEEDENHPNRF